MAVSSVAVALMALNFVLSLHILWARCPGPYSRYWVNRVGQVWGPAGLVGQREVTGYAYITCWLDESAGVYYWSAVAVHRLVLMAWAPSGYRREGLTVDHRDQTRDNYWIYNLRWATASEQILNRTITGASTVRCGCTVHFTAECI